MMNIEFVPRKQLATKLREGWRLVPGHEYNPSDWAILVWLPDVSTPIPAQLVRQIEARFLPKPVGLGNKSVAATSRMLARSRAMA